MARDYCIGNDCSSYLTVNSKPGYVFMGGGTDVDAAFEWQIDRMAAGDFLVLRASGTDAYNPYIWELAGGKVNSITTIVLSDATGASQPFVMNAVAQADAIFFAGGDQTLYVNYLTGTPLVGALQSRARFATVGGTSAGADYLSDIVFAPATDAPSIVSADALANPFTYGMTFANSTYELAGFARGDRRTLVDTHFVARDRMGRGLTFLSRLVKDGLVPVSGGECAYLIAANEKTAFLIETNGSATVVGGAASSAAFVCSLCAEPSVCVPDTPLTAGPFSCEALARGDAYEFSKWAGTGTSYTLSVSKGDIVGNPYGPAGAEMLAVEQ